MVMRRLTKSKQMAKNVISFQVKKYNCAFPDLEYIKAFDDHSCFRREKERDR